MRFISFKYNNHNGIGIVVDNQIKGCTDDHEKYPGDLDFLIQSNNVSQELAKLLAKLDEFDPTKITYLPPLAASSKIICVGLNYVDHSVETGFKPPTYPTIFSRFTSSLIGHQASIIKPSVSDQLDFEGELVVVIGRGGHRIEKAAALEHVLGYSVFNDASIRDYQVKSPQWTMGKNFDGTGAFGPALVTADELPAGCQGLRLQTKLNGELMQDANTSDMIFDVPSLVATISEVLTLAPGDIIVSGTPAGIGWARKPPVFMRDGDVCEIEIEGVGLLRNTVQAE